MSDAAAGLISALPTLRAFARGLMRDTCVVEEAQQVRVGGVTSIVWQTLFTSPCRLSLGSGDEQRTDVQIQAQGTYTAHLPLDVGAVLVTHRLVIGGVTYNVVWAPPLTALSVDRRVGLEQET